jgi:hypothetical protein
MCAPATRKLGDQRLGPGHLCAFHGSDEQHHAMLMSFLQVGLEREEKALYIADAPTIEAASQRLQNAGMEWGDLLSHGRLRIYTAESIFLREGTFDPARVLSWLRNEIEIARAEGYPDLRIVSEMTWATHGAAGSERLLEYEGLMNELLQMKRFLALCLYDRRHFSSAILQYVLAAHPSFVFGSSLCDNFYYRIPPSFFGTGPATATLGRWLDDLGVAQISGHH